MLRDTEAKIVPVVGFELIAGDGPRSPTDGVLRREMPSASGARQKGGSA